MNLHIFPSKVAGTVKVPPSKSLAHRLLICGGLAQGTSVIRNVDFSEDIAATVDCLRAMGAVLEICGDTVSITGCGGAPRISDTLPCRESGSTLRFLIPLCLLDKGGTLTGSDRLMERPLSVYEDLFADRDIVLSRTSRKVSVRGELQPGIFSVPGNVSSQFLTGLLFALPLLKGDSGIETSTPLESASYLRLTLSSLKRFGVTVFEKGEGQFFIPGNQRYCPCDVTVEGDESNAAFFGAFSVTGGNVLLQGRAADTLQGDRVWEALFYRLKDGFCEIVVNDCPDLAPVLMTVAAMNHGARLTGTRRLKIKESDRGVVMAEELAKFGARIQLGEDFIDIFPSVLHCPEVPLSGHNDHRVVMSMAVICAKYGGVIQGAEAVRKSFPGFFEVLKNLNVRLEEI